MNATINHIAFGDEFLVDIGPNVSIFRFRGIPVDMHFSLSYHPEDPDLNFHVTRNSASEGRKPRIVIFKIDKKVADAALNTFGQHLFSLIYEPLPFDYHPGLSRRQFARWVSFFSRRIDCIGRRR